ncbi:uncharacterized protein LOC124159261 [Ischnura elegans]|uniref:uncharacterized protein LOC124159261 n=1 Tax=Ischnura elegans TaxID=197161 RepID=UPI001ED877B7|nr:uncharacterized protein LOC124159261 [Ischnura elegans]
MIHLLYQLSWFLLGMSGLLTATLSMAILLKWKKPGAANVLSKLSLALSCVAALTVLYSGGYISMKLYSADDEEACAFFGLKIKPNETHSTMVAHTSSQPKFKASVASVFWMVITEDCVMLDKVLLWIGIWLCIGAILSFFFVLKNASHQRRIEKKSSEIKKALLTRLMNSHHMKKLSAGEDSTATKIKGHTPSVCSPVGRIVHFGVRAPYRPVPKRILWTTTAAIIIFSVTLAGALLLNHYYSNTKERLMYRNCVSRDYVPLKHMASGGALWKNITDELHLPMHIVSRDEWMAMPPKETKPLKNPVGHVILTHNAEGSCSTHDECIAAVQMMQANNMGPRDDMLDIAGNFLIAGDGRAYVGRGWTARADDAGYFTNDSITVMFMGTAVNTTPTKGQVQAFNELIGEGIRDGHVAKDVKIVLGRKSKKSELKALMN